MAHKTLVDIKGYEGLYAVTPDGRVWSYRTSTWLNYDYGHGYRRVTFTVDGKKKKFAVHRLVAEAYIPNPDNLPEVDHIDRDKSNNSVENLRWVTKSQNAFNREGKNRRVKCVETGQIFESIAEASRQTGCASTNIVNVCKGKKKTCGGFHWKYVE